jgi:prepilin-type N-terminal cleavage/methylation domain-containing protein
MIQGIMATRPSGLRSRTNLPSAFTLIELLSVIAILAVITSLLLPMVSKMRELGSQQKSQSNLRQLALGMLAFSTENDGRLPGLSGRGIPTWDVAITPYTGGVEETKKLLADPNDRIKPIPNSSKRSYAYNPVACPPDTYYIDYCGGGPQLYLGIQASNIKSPSKFPLLLEEYRDYNVYGSNWAEITCGWAVRTIGGKPGLYVAYADSHVAFLAQDPGFDWLKWMESNLANK